MDHLLMMQFELQTKIEMIKDIITNMFDNTVRKYRYTNHTEATNHAKEKDMRKKREDDEYFDRIEGNLSKQMSKTHILNSNLLNTFENTLKENKECNQLIN
jgi:hypothetical protein